jgi:hypothetical protein
LIGVCIELSACYYHITIKLQTDDHYFQTELFHPMGADTLPEWVGSAIGIE